jgi:hypothetical protein
VQRVLVLLAMVDCVATASIWWYLVQFKITDKFLFAISAVWVFAICALVVLLVYVLSELNDQLLSLSRLHKQ